MAITGTRARGIFTALLFSTMGVGTFVALSLGIVAVIIIDDLDISRAQLGVAFSVNVIGAAIFSPFIGHITDRIGGKRALLVVSGAAIVSYLILGAAQSLAVLVVGSAIGGLAQAGTNPATNKLIAEDLPPGSQGIVTGIKQSGVQAFVFAGGMLLPTMALAWNRFAAYAVLAGIAGLLGVVGWAFLPAASRATGDAAAPVRAPMPVDIWWITGYGTVMGFAGSVTVLYALYTTERLGRSVVLGGAVAAVVGITAMVSRIAWAHFAERREAYRTALMVMALLSVIAPVLLFAADRFWWGLVFIGAVLTGLGSSSWNSVGMLGLIVLAGSDAAGRASGFVLAGFLVGLGAGPPVFGWMIDTTGSYGPVWAVSAAAAAAGAGVMALWRPQRST